jgi:Polyketide cyclase / dehydrase and lipid transport
MAQPLVVEQSRAIPVTPEAAFTATVPMPLPTLFQRWYGPIPPIKAVVDQTGDWDAVGKTRTVVLTGGGSMREQLTSYDPPRSFAPVLPVFGRLWLGTQDSRSRSCRTNWCGDAQGIR